MWTLVYFGRFCVLFLMRTMVKDPWKKRVVRTKQGSQDPFKLSSNRDREYRCNVQASEVYAS